MRVEKRELRWGIVVCLSSLFAHPCWSCSVPSHFLPHSFSHFPSPNKQQEERQRTYLNVIPLHFCPLSFSTIVSLSSLNLNAFCDYSTPFFFSLSEMQYRHHHHWVATGYNKQLDTYDYFPRVGKTVTTTGRQSHKQTGRQTMNGSEASQIHRSLDRMAGR